MGTHRPRRRLRCVRPCRHPVRLIVRGRPVVAVSDLQRGKDSPVPDLTGGVRNSEVAVVMDV